MEGIEKLKQIQQFMRVEAAEDVKAPPSSAQPPGCYSPAHRKPPMPDEELPIAHAVLPGGKTISLLKTLLTSACERNCYYCAFRAGRDFHRTTFSPDDLSHTFMDLYRARKVEGIFLSSGVAGGGIRTQDRLLAAGEILRHKLGYTGYLHLKIMPGAEWAQVERAMQLADRVSVNLEAPNTQRLARLAPQKVMMEELIQPLRWVEEIRRTMPAYLGWNGRWPSSCTQFVAGGAGESDLELLQTTEYLHHQLRLARVYFSGFNPVLDTPLENEEPMNPWREHRLYQAAFLLRDYGFGQEELPYSPDGNLPLETDPKLAWAKDHLADHPIELNKADLHELLRIPGIGPHGAKAILDTRRKDPIKQVGQLKALGILTRRAAPFILLNGLKAPVQLALW